MAAPGRDRTTRTWLRAPRKLALTAVVCASALLAGCKDEIYSNLTEDDANQMMATLLANSISTDKSSQGKDGFMLSVDEADMLRAIAVLKDAGFPKIKRDSIGQVFQQSGLMSSPFEERVRYIYALGEDVAQTLSHIDGVMTARVHIVLPEAPELGQAVKPSSAAVFIKHAPGVDLDYFVPQIKRLVSSSIEGLDYSAVTVVLAEATPMKEEPIGEKRATVEVLPGLSVSDADQSHFWEWGIAGIALIVALLASNLAILFLWRGKTFFKRNKETEGSPLVEPS